MSLPPEYPKNRGNFFANRFIRILHKSCAAQDIGHAACYLLCLIAQTEDSARYKCPVRFWNSQLMETMAFTSPKQLDRARDLAIAAGWLQYWRDGNRSVGKYFVTIPECFSEISDSPIEPEHEWNHSSNLSPGGMNGGTINGKDVDPITSRIEAQLRLESVSNSGKPSCPIPSPVPDPDPNTAAASPDQCSVNGKPVRIPEALDTPEVREALASWLKFKRRKGQGYKEAEYIEKKVAEFEPLGPDAFVAAVNSSIGSNYAGLFPADGGKAKPTHRELTLIPE